MRPDDLENMLWFIAVAEERSFTRAAGKLGIAQSSLSQKVKDLEARLGLRLLARTTRSVALTDAGQRLLQTLAPRMAVIEAEIDELMALRDKPSGSVRITLADYALESVVWPKLRGVLINYPDIKLELISDNGFRNIVEDGFDAGVRLGESLEKDMIAMRIGPDWRLVTVASPAYLKQHGEPVHPQQLTHHNCINQRQITSGGLYAWEFAKDGQALRVRVDGQLTFNASYGMIDAALNGYGIANVPESLVDRLVKARKLRIVLDEWCPLFPGFYLYYPSRKQHSAAFNVVARALGVKV